MSHPLLSVVVMIDRQRQRGAECLNELLKQSMIDQMEIILLDFADTDSTPLPGIKHPSVRVTKIGRGLNFGEAKTQGVVLCQAPIVAFVEEHVRVFPQWAEAVIEAHKQPYAAIGGEIHNGSPGMGISDIIAMMNYQGWLPPLKRHEARWLDSHNATYKREYLLKYEQQLPFWLSSEIIFHLKLVQDGYKLLSDPTIKHAHINEYDLTICKGYYLFNRVLAGRRKQLSRRSMFTGLLRVWFLPLARTAKFLIQTRRNAPQNFRQLARNTHIILLTQLFSAAGQLVGILIGVGNADELFLDYEMNIKRRATDLE